MIKQPAYKIALVGDTLSEGGAERVQARLSLFFESRGIEVHHIIVRDLVTYEYGGVLFNMGKLKNASNSVSNKLGRFRALKNYLREHQFDFIIDFRVKNRFLQEFLITRLLYTSPYIMTIRSFNTAYYFPKNTAFAKKIYKNAFGIVTVSKALEKKIRNEYGYKKVTTIYNPVFSEATIESTSENKGFDFPYILGMGRFHPIKQFEHLILAYAASEAPSKNIKLVLAGEGDDKVLLVNLTREHQIEDHVVFLPYQTNPLPLFENALFTALTSKNEGFPNILIESLSSATPVVAYDCESGPSELISHENNGLLVKNQDINAMTAAINSMINDTELYRKCKKNAVESVAKFDIDIIGNQWLKFLNIPEIV